MILWGLLAIHVMYTWYQCSVSRMLGLWPVVLGACMNPNTLWMDAQQIPHLFLHCHIVWTNATITIMCVAFQVQIQSNIWLVVSSSKHISGQKVCSYSSFLNRPSEHQTPHKLTLRTTIHAYTLYTILTFASTICFLCEPSGHPKFHNFPSLLVGF